MITDQPAVIKAIKDTIVVHSSVCKSHLVCYEKVDHLYSIRVSNSLDGRCYHPCSIHALRYLQTAHQFRCIWPISCAKCRSH